MPKDKDKNVPTARKSTGGQRPARPYKQTAARSTGAPAPLVESIFDLATPIAGEAIATDKPAAALARPVSIGGALMPTQVVESVAPPAAVQMRAAKKRSAAAQSIDADAPLPTQVVEFVASPTPAAGKTRAAKKRSMQPMDVDGPLPGKVDALPVTDCGPKTQKNQATDCASHSTRRAHDHVGHLQAGYSGLY